MCFLAIDAVLRQMVYCARFVQLLLELPDFIAVSAHEPRELVDNSGVGKRADSALFQTANCPRAYAPRSHRAYTSCCAALPPDCSVSATQFPEAPRAAAFRTAGFPNPRHMKTEYCSRTHPAPMRAYSCRFQSGSRFARSGRCCFRAFYTPPTLPIKTAALFRPRSPLKSSVSSRLRWPPSQFPIWPPAPPVLPLLCWSTSSCLLFSLPLRSVRFS